VKVPDVLAARARLHPDTPALVDTRSGREHSYAEASQRAGRTAAYLRDQLGVRAGDRVGLLSGNRAEIIELLVACGRIGAVLVPLNWRLPASELSQIVADCTPAVLVCDRTHAATAAELARPVVDLDEGWEQAIAACPPVPDRGMVDVAEVWYLLYTSGTTGAPKGVIQTFGMALVNYLNIGTAVGLTSADVTVNPLPMFHTGGINLHVLPTLLAGGTAIVVHEFDPGLVLTLLSERGTAFFGVPTMYQLLAEHPDFATTDLSRVRSWASGGAPFPVPLLTSLAERGVVVRQGMGMTETGPTVFLIDEAHAVSRAGSVGKAQPFVEVSLDGVDGDGAGEGELLIRGPGVTPGYWQRPEATAAAFTADGRLRSGDVARRDADGYYTIVDRIKDMFISGGENVYPAELERVLITHPDVTDVAVVGVPDPRWGEVGKAVLVTSGPVEPEQIRTFCRQHLAAYKVPVHIEQVAELPRNAAGKVLKAQLRQPPPTSQEIRQ
jgi:fatty-acyl-CoA synthase